MTLARRTLALAFLLSAKILAAQTATAPKSPDEFMPHKRGEQFTRHDQLTDYFEHLAANAPRTMRLERYGMTNEDRPLQIAIFSSEENMARLEQIRLNNLRLAGTEPGTPDVANAPAIVWLSMSVHGNEPSGSECSPELAFRLATQTDPQVREWLRNTVVILDPSLNPDGYSRYVNWYRGVANLIPNANHDAREHSEPWPGGRVNHYYFDLNRDWAWATQVESQQRLAVYHRWLPHVHADLHEQYFDNPYYFAPAAEPMHDLITPWQRSFQTQIGQNHARYFDENGWLYFTKEVFDLFYPSYGDTYPMFNGAIGMTYEQAGHSRAGRAISLANGDTLWLEDRIAHHLTTSLSSIEMGSKNAQNLVKNFRDYYANAATKPQGAWLSFVIREANDQNKVNALCELLDRHHIQYGRVGSPMPSVRAFDYVAGKETNVSIQPNDLIISAFQPHSVLVQALFEPEPHLSDSLTYDITAWALPYAYGLEAFALKQRIEPKFDRVNWKPGEVSVPTKPYAWCLHRQSLAEAQFLADLLQQGVHVRYATKAFDVADDKFQPGALVITRADNMSMDADLDRMVQATAKRHNVKAIPMLSGWMGTKGRDLGSDAFRLLEKPDVAIVWGDDVEENSFGHVWHFFERELGYPITPIHLDKLARANLRDFNVLIFPHGSYRFDDDDLKSLKTWVQNGGRLIGLEGGARAFADKDGFDLKSKAEEKKDTGAVKPKPYQSQERDGVSDQLPGAIVRASMDNSHPLGYGLADSYFSLKTGPSAFDLLKSGENVAWLDDKYFSVGFVGARVRPRLKNSPIAAVQRMGGGQVVYFVDNPMFRSFWYQGKVLFANALFF